ncbi:MAG: hypothetical protein JW850_19625 [Thermoflexales bacterium]|nr:hypothetical protein [Thermoflexales bacterium]
MNLAQDHSTLYENLADLQEQSLTLIAFFVGSLAYACFLWVNWVQLTGPAHVVASIGIGLLVLAALGSHLLKQSHLRIATHLLVWPVLGANVCAVFVFAAPEMAYLFILPIIFASVLLSRPAHLVVAVASGSF